MSLLLIGDAYAEPHTLGSIKENWGSTLAGAAATVAIHELGHFLVAETEGVNAAFDGVTVTYENTENTERQDLRLSSAGYQFQWLVSEYAFSQLERPQLSVQARAWNSGLILGHIAITAAYLSILKDHEDGDVAGTSAATGLSTDQMLGILALPTLLDGWRLFGKNSPQWANWTSRSFKSLGISAVWLF